MHIGIIVPRYGPDILGGAETLARGLAEQLAKHDHEVHVWTSCAQDYHNWANVYPAGHKVCNGVHVHRFPVQFQDEAKHFALSQQLVTQATLPTNQQYEWLASGIHSPALYEQVAKQATAVDLILTLPYLSTLMQYAAWIAPEKVICLPCLHDEPYAYLEPCRLLLASVRGLMFLTPEEQALCRHSLKIETARQAVLGAAVSEPPAALPSISLPDAPYLLCIARLEPAKNLALLYDYAQRYVDEGGELRLVVLSSGSLQPPEHPVFDCRGFLPEEEKLALAANTLALCHPSLNESFSLVMMETWLLERPSLVHKACPVTSGHIQRSRGGLTFATYAEFATAVDWLKTHPAEAGEMGHNGRTYVQQNYTWPIVLARFHHILQTWDATGK